MHSGGVGHFCRACSRSHFHFPFLLCSVLSSILAIEGGLRAWTAMGCDAEFIYLPIYLPTYLIYPTYLHLISISKPRSKIQICIHISTHTYIYIHHFLTGKQVRCIRTSTSFPTILPSLLPPHSKVCRTFKPSGAKPIQANTIIPNHT